MGSIESLFVGLGLDASGYSSDVDSAADDTSRFVEKATSGFGRFDEVVTGALHRVGEVAVNTGAKIGAALVEQGQQALDVAAKYESMENVFAVTSGANEEQMKRMSAIALQLGEDVSLPGASAKTAAEAMVELNRRGIDIENSFSGAKGVLQLAAAAGLDVKDAATVGANALDIYGLKGQDLIKVNDMLVNTFKSTGASVPSLAEGLETVGPVMSQLNIPFDKTLVMLGELAKKGIEGSEAGTQLRGTFMSLMNPSNEAKNALADLNIAVYDHAGAMKTPIQLIEEFSKVQVGSQVTMRMTGDELEKIAEKADKTRDQIGKLTEKNIELGDKLAEQAEKIPKAIEAFQTKRTQAEEDHRDKLLKLVADADQKREDLATSLTGKLLTIDQGHQDKLLKLAEDAADKRAGIETSYGEKLAGLATACQQKLTSLDASYQQKLIDQAEAAQDKREDLERDYGDKLQDLAAAYQRKVGDIAESFQQKQIDASAKYHADLEKLETAHEGRVTAINQKIADAAAAYQQGQLDRARAFAQKIADIDRKAAYKQQDVSEDYQYDQEDRAESHQEKLADLQTDLQRKLGDLERQLQGDLTDKQRAAIQQRMADAQTAYDRAVADEVLRYKRQEDDAKDHYDRQLEQLQQQHDREVAEAQAAAAEQQAEADAAYAAQQAQLDRQLQAEMDAYAQQQAQRKAAYDQQLIDLHAQQAAAQDAAQQAYEQQQTAAATAYQRQLDDLAIALQRQQEAAQQAYEQQRIAAQQDYAQKQVDAQRAHDAALVAVDAALAKQQQAEQAAYERSKQQAQTAYAEQLAAVQTNLDRQTAEQDAAYTKQQQRAKQAFDSSLAELAAGIEKRTAELQKEMAANDAAISSADAMLATYSQTIATGGAKTVELTQAMRDQALATIFGRENMGAANIVLAGGTELYNDLTEKINKTGSAQELAAATTQGLEGAVSGLTNTWETLQLELGKEALPVATEAMRVFTKLISDNKENIKDFVNNTIIPLANKVVDVADGFTKASDKTKYLKDTIEQNSGPIADAIGGLAIKAAGVLGSLAPKIGVALLQGIEKGLNDHWGAGAGTGIVTVLTGGMWRLITEFWGISSPSTKMMGMAGDLIAGLWNGFSAKAGEMGTNVYRWFDENIVHRMRGLLNTFPDIGRSIADSLWSGLQAAWGPISQRFTDLWNQIPQSIRDALQMHSPSRVLWGLGEQAGWSVARGAEQMQGAVESAGAKLGDALASGVGPLNLDASVNGAASGGGAADVSANVSADVPPAAASGAMERPLVINLYPQGPVVTPRDLIVEIRRGINEENRRNGRAEI